MKLIIQCLTASALLVFGSAAIAEERGETNGIAYVSGGVAEEPRESLQDRAHLKYSLKLIFATTSADEQGNITHPYRALVPVRIFDNTDNMVFETVSKGPLLYVDLPAGSYKVCIDEGTDDQRDFTVTDTGTTEIRFVSETDMGIGP